MNIQSVSSLSIATSTTRPAVADAASKASDVVATTTFSEDQQTQASPNTKGNDDELKEVVKAVNDFVKPFNDALSFSIDTETGTTVVKVIDKETDEVIKQIPSEEMLALTKALDQLRGLLVKQKA